MTTTLNASASSSPRPKQEKKQQQHNQQEEEEVNELRRRPCVRSRRLVNRDLAYSQSRNKVVIQHTQTPKKDLWSIWLWEGWFHVLLRRNLVVSLSFLLGLWTGVILLFAAIYQALDHYYFVHDITCGLSGDDNSIHFGGAFAFSLETATTVGYGLPGSTNAFFENCPIVQIFIYFQMTFSMMYNSFLFGFFLYRLARSDARGSQVIFSQTCTIRRCSPRRTKHNNNNNGTPTTNDNWMLEIRVFDIDASHPVVEAHARLYARLPRSSSATTATDNNNNNAELVPMRLVQPNDELGGMLFLSLPSTIRHEIDRFSPLYPNQEDDDDEQHTTTTTKTATITTKTSTLVPHKHYRLCRPSGLRSLREADSVTAGREEVVCPACGEAYGDIDRLRVHVHYNQVMEGNDLGEDIGPHFALDVDKIQQPPPPTLSQLQACFPEEIICVVEGIDPMISGTFAALQSYTLGEVSWGGQFAECVYVQKKNNITAVDLGKYHQVIFPREEEEEDYDLSSSQQQQQQQQQEKNDNYDNDAISQHNKDDDDDDDDDDKKNNEHNNDQ